MKVQVRAMVEYLQRHPEAMGELSKEAAAKYRRLLDEAGTPLCPQPGEIVEKYAGRLREALEWLLQEGSGMVNGWPGWDFAYWFSV